MVGALAGWSLVFLQGRSIERLEASLAAAQERGADQDDAAAVSGQVLAKLDDLKRELQETRDERDALDVIVHRSDSELRRLQSELEAANRVLGEGSLPFRARTRTRVRAAPTTDAEEVAVISQGAGLEVVDTVADGTWHEIRVLGYAFHELLEPRTED